MDAQLHARPFLSSISFELGQAVPLGDLDDAEVRQFLDQLNRDGMTKCVVSERSPVEDASECARRSLLTPAGAIEPDLAILCSDTLAPLTPARAARTFTEAVDLPHLPVVNVSGGDCGNFGMGLRLACGVLAAESLSNVLLVTTDDAGGRSRYLANGLTAISDGAASCLISAQPATRGFAILGLASTWAARITDSSTPAGALTIVRSVRRIARQMLGQVGITAPDCRYLIVGNYGRAARNLFANALGLPESAVCTPLLTEVAHCQSADLLLSLNALAERDELKPGDRLVLLSCGTRNWTLIVVEYVA
jgi:3-oxoacyl-[acyl-carrier-protein] synthase-3